MNKNFDPVKYANEYNRTHYARINMAVPPEVKDEIVQQAQYLGYRSITEYILSSLPLATYCNVDDRRYISSALRKKEG